MHPTTISPSTIVQLRTESVTLTLILIVGLTTYIEPKAIANKLFPLESTIV